MSVKITRELAGYLRRQPRAFSAAIETEVERQARRLSAAQRAAYTSLLQPPDETGGGLASIRVEDGRDHLTKLVLAGGELSTRGGYDHMLGFEFGTQRQPARSFFYSTARALNSSMREAIQKSVEKSIEG